MSATETTPNGERSEEVLSWVGVAAVVAIRVAELAVIAVAAVFVAPPLVILAVIVLVPAIALAAVVGLVALPVLVVRHAHRHRAAHAHRLVRRLADMGRSEQAAARSRVRRIVARAQRKLYA
jgi:hypothetical protein